MSYSTTFWIAAQRARQYCINFSCKQFDFALQLIVQRSWASKRYLLGCLLTLCSSTALATPDSTKQMQKFIAKMVEQHQFAASELEPLFAAVEIKQNILDAIAKPAEGLPWFKYRNIFLQPSRIEEGVNFWQENKAIFEAVEKQYHVPPQIITAIIGVETRYGAHSGSYRVLDALSTLAFAYPKRSKFFSGELENFLLLCRQENIDPRKPHGSYAGAMGMPQFMPSSYLTYAVDFDQDHKRDIWQNKADTIASVANYFVSHKWQPGKAIAYPIMALDESYQPLLTQGLKPDISVAQLRQAKLQIPTFLDDQESVKLLSYQQQQGNELWVGLHNFYVITRYNHSHLYAMAVYQLSLAIAEKKNQHAP